MKINHCLIEQMAIFDGEPDFISVEAAMYLINHHSYGGTPKDFQQAKDDGILENPKRYRVTLTLDYEEIS